jgi:hypothetical protein
MWQKGNGQWQTKATFASTPTASYGRPAAGPM